MADFTLEAKCDSPRSFLPIFLLHPCSGVCGDEGYHWTSSDMKTAKARKRENSRKVENWKKIHALAKLPRKQPRSCPENDLNQSLMKPLQVRMIADAPCHIVSIPIVLDHEDSAELKKNTI
jgi:hypothetical protein